MATLSAAAIEIANSLPVESIATKLRCGNCNKLAVDAVKLPCCDTSLCHPCSLDVTEICPVCAHSPVSADDCKPFKSLRTTVSAYIKTEQSKRERAKREQDAQAAAAASVPVAAPSEASPSATVQDSEVTADSATNGATGTPALERANSPQGEADVRLEITNEVQMTGERAGDEAIAEADDDDQNVEYDDEDDVIITTHKPEDDVQQETQMQEETFETQQGNGEEQDHRPEMNDQQHGFANYDQQNQQSGFGNSGMGFGNNNNFNPMMSGVGMGGFGMGMGMPKMMGMPGMMDPSMMFGNGCGFGGMDMSQMMNIGMGPMGMGGFGGMMGGGGGFRGPGGFNGQNGYNNQNFGNSMNQQFRNDRGGGFGGRPYGHGFNRGRGYNGFNRGRGGYGGFQGQNFGQQQQYGQNQAMMNQQQQAAGSMSAHSGQSGRRASPTYEPINGTETDATQLARDQDTELPEADDTNGAESTNPTVAEGEEVTQSVEDQGAPNGDASYDGEGTVQGGPASEQMNGDAGTQRQGYGDDSVPPDANDMDMTDMNGAPQHDEYAYDNQQAYNNNFNFGPRGRGGFRGARGGFRSGRGGFVPAGMQTEALDLTPTPAPPVNAPSGPKAMREGRPNTGYFARPAPAAPPKAPTPVAPTPQRDDSRSRPQERDDRDRDYDERSQSRSRHRSRKHKHGDDSEEYESEESRRRRKDKERERKHRDRRDRESKYDDDDAEHSSRKGRSREESRDEKHSSRRHFDNDDERRSSHSHRDETRKKRNRSRSPERDASINGEDGYRSSRKSKSDRKYDHEYDVKSKDRGKRHSRREDKHDDVDRSRRHSRSSRDDGNGREPATVRSVIEPESDDLGFKIKGSKSASLNPAGMGPPPRRASDRHERRPSMADSAPQTPSTPTAATGDPYADERKRQIAARERKEQQRRHTTSLGKRMSRDEDKLQAPSGPKSDQSRKRSRKDGGRRISVKYEDEVAGGEEERENGRWR